MWIMTTRGFYSAVQHRDFPTRLLIRARCKEDIDNLHDLLPNSKPYRHDYSDYEWRLDCTVAEWAGALASMALDIDYANFKNAVSREQGAKRASVYHQVWSLLLTLERSDRFTRGGSRFGKVPTATKGKAKSKPAKKAPRRRSR